MFVTQHWGGDKIEIKTLHPAVRVYQVAWELLGTRLVTTIVRLTEHDSNQLLGLQGRLQLSASDILHLHTQAGGQGGAGDDGEEDEERAHAAITSYQSAHSSQVTL